MGKKLSDQLQAIAEAIDRIDSVLKDLHTREEDIGTLINDKLEEIIRAKNLNPDTHPAIFEKIREDLETKYKGIIAEKISILEKEKESLVELKKEVSAF